MLPLQNGVPKEIEVIYDDAVQGLQLREAAEFGNELTDHGSELLKYMRDERVAILGIRGLLSTIQSNLQRAQQNFADEFRSIPGCDRDATCAALRVSVIQIGHINF